MVLPILMILIFGIVEFGNAFWTYQQVSAATSEGARKAAVSRSSTTRTADIATAVKNGAPSLNSSKFTITTTSAWTPGSPVTVASSYKLNTLGLGLLTKFGFDGTLDVSRTARVEQ
jgi:Flp pilus assembly protein TadG